MNNLRSKLKRLMTPVAVLLLVAAVAIMTPLTSMIGAIRLHAETSDPTSVLKVANLPARYAKVNTSLGGAGNPAIPALTGATGDNTTKVMLAHAGQEKAVGSTVTYAEAGKYEWRFYYNDVLFDTYTVLVTASNYAITMPSVIPTVAPKDIDNLELPLPTAYTMDGEDLTLGDDYELVVKAALGTKTIHDITIGAEKVTIKFVAADGFESNTDKVGTLKVTYLLKDKTTHKTLAAKALSDIEIKDLNKNEVTFANNPSAPSVSGLSFQVPVKLSSPEADSAKYKNTSFAVEATTKITKVKFYDSPTAPNDWNKNVTVLSVTYQNGVYEDETGIIKIEDGMTVTAKKLGWYKFEFTTDTLFGYTTEDKTNGVYESDAVSVKQDDQAPQFKWVNEYGEDNIAELNDTFDDLEDNYSKYLPMSDKPESTTTKKITVCPNEANNYKGIVLPALFPHDNNTKFADLEVSVTAEQIKNSSWNDVTNNIVTIYNSGDNKYNPGAKLNINFMGSSTPTSGNVINLKRENGLYRVTIRVQEQRPTYTDGTKDSGWARSVSKYLYFMVDQTYDENKTENSPVIDEAGVFQVSDVYLWEGNTFDFKVPTCVDVHTATANLLTDYYLVSINTADKTKNQAIKLDTKQINNGRMTVNLDELSETLKTDNDEFYIYAVARNYNYAQNELQNGAYVLTFDGEGHLPTNTAANGIAWKSAKFNIYTTDSAVATADIAITVAGSSHTAGDKVHISNITATWLDNAIDSEISVAVYRVKEDKQLVPVDVVNHNDSKKAEVVSAVLFNKQTVTTNTITDWYFTPGISGEYQIVVTAKEHASATRYTMIKTITVDPRNDLVVTPLSDDDTTVTATTTINNTVTLGEATILPNYSISDYAGSVKYLAKNRVVYNATTNVAVGDYTVTVKGVNDPNCVIGNKFVPNKTGTYVFAYDFYMNGDDEPFETEVYRIQVTNAADATSNIKIGNNYGDENQATLIWKDSTGKDENTQPSGATANEPEYAITLPEFNLANVGGSTNIIVDRATLVKYLEPIKDSDGKDYHYMYPAIAIPMPNVINDSMSSDEVEITVQKSGSSDYLVSTKKQNTSNGASVIGYQIDNFYVFRPDGEFKTKDANFMKDSNNANGVYVVTYSTKDTTLTFNVTFGDPNVGELKFDAGFLTYQNGEKNIDEDNANPQITPVKDGDNAGKRLVTIDLKKLVYSGNSDMLALIKAGVTTSESGAPEEILIADYLKENARVSVTYEGNSFIDSYKWSTYDIDDGNPYTYVFDCDKGSGTYKVLVSLYNKYTQSTVTQDFEFTLDISSKTNSINLSTVWGIILIILSVGLLAGVVFYFIKTSRETRFLDAPKKSKVKKEKNSSVEEPKADVK